MLNALNTQVAKATPYLGQERSYGRNRAARVGKIDAEAGNFVISFKNGYNAKKIEDLYKYDYRVSSLDMKCDMVW